MPKESKYKKIDEDSFYETDKGRGIIRLNENKETKDKSLMLSHQAKNNKGEWVQRRGEYFSVPFGKKVINIFLRFMSKLGLNIESKDKPDEQIINLKEQLDNALREKSNIENIKLNLETEIKTNLEKIEELRKQVLKDNIHTFNEDLVKFQEILNESEVEPKKEEELQKFLNEKSWIFSPEYVNVKPKKPVGSKSIFDFYLEDYKGQGTVVELEKPTDLIFSTKEKFGLSTKCAESLGQLIRYVEDTISYSSNKQVSKKEGIDENKPLGFLVIGRTKTADEIDSLKIINSYLHSIKIISYDLLLLRAKKMIEGFDILNNKLPDNILKQNGN